jgi:hypothetical protein
MLVLLSKDPKATDECDVYNIMMMMLDTTTHGAEDNKASARAYDGYKKSSKFAFVASRKKATILIE